MNVAGNNAHDNNSESPIIVWFDTNAYEEGNRVTRELLQATIGSLMIFNDKVECKRLFGRDLNIKRLVLIISGQLGKEFIPLIHGYTSILSIYIYCSNKPLHEEWAKKYTKVKAVVTTLDELVSEILSDPQIT